jgi:hypothetical protein
VRFRATLELHGKTATGMKVPAEVVESLAAGKRPPVVVTIRGYTFRTTVAPMGGSYLIGVSAGHRAAAGVAAGDELDVEVSLDTEVREVEVPADLAAALDEHSGARERFDRLSYSHRKEWVRSITEAKKPETRVRRIAKAVEAMQAG